MIGEHGGKAYSTDSQGAEQEYKSQKADWPMTKADDGYCGKYDCNCNENGEVAPWKGQHLYCIALHRGVLAGIVWDWFIYARYSAEGGGDGRGFGVMMVFGKRFGRRSRARYQDMVDTLLSGHG